MTDSTCCGDCKATAVEEQAQQISQDVISITQYYEEAGASILAEVISILARHLADYVDPS